MHSLFFTKFFELLTVKSGFNFGDFLNYWGGLLFSLTVIVGVVWAVVKFFVIPPAKHWIKEWGLEVTKQIQPDANGGKSLTDANKKIDKIATKQDEATSRLDTLEKMTELKFKHIQEGIDRIEKHLDGK